MSPIVESQRTLTPDRPSVTDSETANAFEGITDWPIVRNQRLHALIVGPPALADEMLARELPSVGGCAVRWSESGHPEMPGVSPTIVIRDVHDLTSLQQRRLLEWLELNPALQVISTASSPVYPLVVNGRFLAPLYYRLNVFSFFLQG